MAFGTPEHRGRKRADGQPTPNAQAHSGLAVALIAFALPAVLLWWYPLISIPGFGRVSALDVDLMALWPVTLWHYLRRTKSSGSIKRAGRVVMFAVLPGITAALGTILFVGLHGDPGPNGSSNPLHEVALHMKRFGLSAILPLAMSLFASLRLKRAVLISACSCFAILLPSVLVPDLLLSLPIDEAYRSSTEAQVEVSQSSGEYDRRIGLITNPNDLAYVAVILLVIVLASTPPYSKNHVYNAINVAAFAVTLLLLVLSASRSGMLGFLGGMLFYVLRARTVPFKQKVMVLAAICATVLLGLGYSESFSARVTAALVERTRERNASGRIEAQAVNFIAWLQNPLGVGYLNTESATASLSRGMAFNGVRGSDSIYLDTLLGAGALGFAALIALWVQCWRHVSNDGGRSWTRGRTLQAGCIAVYIFGLASVIPISVFVAPAFFTMVGCGSLIGFGTGQQDKEGI